MIVGLFSALYVQYRATLVSALAPMIASVPLLPPLRTLIAHYLGPSQHEYSQLALVPSMDGDEEFGDWLLEWDNCDLILKHPQRSVHDMSTSDYEMVSTDDIVSTEELDDLPSLVDRVYTAEDYNDGPPPSELPVLLAKLMNYRFQRLLETPLAEVWPKLVAFSRFDGTWKT